MLQYTVGKFVPFFTEHKRQTRDHWLIPIFPLGKLIQEEKQVYFWAARATFTRRTFQINVTAIRTYKENNNNNTIFSYNFSSTCCGLGILYPLSSNFAIFFASFPGYGEPPKIKRVL